MQSTKQQYIQQPICTVNGERIIKKYRKLKLVGQGSYSKCWLVQTQNSDSTYVAKIIPKKKLQLLTRQKLVYQIRIHQQLSHPNVVHLDHWFEDNISQYIFLQYCSEGNLQKKLSTRSHMSQNDIRYYVKQIIDSLTYIHSKNILHRDLKLCNFYLDSNNQVKLGDFGFACQLSYSNQLKRQSCGTPNYIAPQAVSGFGYSFSSDIWGIGVILYRLKFKLCPFQGRSVRQTLERVKTCNYMFPKGEKISLELKDLIQKIFVINYDERLTLEQIISHPFFTNKTNKIPNVSKSEAKGFAMIRNIFSRDKGKEREGQDVTKRSNSCQTFKQIKEIFKNKSKGTLNTSQNTDMKTQQNLGFSSISHSNRQRSSIGGGISLRSVAQTSFGNQLITKRLQSNHRVNNFIGSVKQQMKIQSKPQQKIPQNSSLSQQLISICKKHYLPYEVQLQKDVTIIHYKDSIKQLLYNGNSYLLHRSRLQLYDMTGSLYHNPPKMLRYIIDNKVTIVQAEPQQEEYGPNTIEKILLFVAHHCIIVKDGVVLRFGSGGGGGAFVGKMTSQQLFYIGSSVREGERLKEDGKMSLMYLREGKSYKSAEGVVLSRIYQGWVGNAFKTYKE